MNVLLISESFIIREALGNLLKSFFNISTLDIVNNSNNIKDESLEKLDFLVVDVKEDVGEKVEFLIRVKKYFNNIKVMTLDMNKDKKVCEKLIKMGVEGYVVDIGEKEDFIYGINKILQGRKIYEADLITSILNDKNRFSSETLTKREKDVLYKIGDGYNNREIANVLYITEYTVKKHVSSILSKLNLRDRKEVIIYINKDLKNMA
ncbi:MAG: response regulator transcription factor [Bacilli bacterium]